MKIYIKKIDGLQLPKKGSDVAAGYDIVATSEPTIVGTGMQIPTIDGEITAWEQIEYITYETGLFISPESTDVHCLIHPRSSISKYNLVLANSIGLVDNDYRGEIKCRFKYCFQPSDFRPRMNDKNEPFDFKLFGLVDISKIYKKGDVIAQLVFESTAKVEWELVDDLDQTKRGTGGFGSTDKKLGFDPNPNTKINSDSKILNKPSLIDIYKKSGGIEVKEKYTEEVKSQIQEI